MLDPGIHSPKINPDQVLQQCSGPSPAPPKPDSAKPGIPVLVRGAAFSRTLEPCTDLPTITASEGRPCPHPSGLGATVPGEDEERRPQQKADALQMKLSQEAPEQRSLMFSDMSHPLALKATVSAEKKKCQCHLNTGHTGPQARIIRTHGFRSPGTPITTTTPAPPPRSDFHMDVESFFSYIWAFNHPTHMLMTSKIPPETRCVSSVCHQLPVP